MLPRSPTDLESSFKAKSCRSFVRTKNISNEHRNKSVPHNLQVLDMFPLLLDWPSPSQFKVSVPLPLPWAKCVCVLGVRADGDVVFVLEMMTSVIHTIVVVVFTAAVCHCCDESRFHSFPKWRVMYVS